MTTPNHHPEVPVTITLTNRQLHELVKPVLPLTSAPGHHLSVLEAVEISRLGDHLYATATDRYRAGVKRVKVDGMEGDFTALLDAYELSRALNLFRPGRRSYLNQPKVTLSLADGYAVLTAVPGTTADNQHDHPRIEVGVSTKTGEFPKVRQVIRKAISVEERVTSFGFNGDYLASFKEAVIHSGSLGSPPRIVLTLGATSREPALVHVGDDFIGLLMPRMNRGEPEALEGQSSAWPEALEALEAPKALS